MRDDKSIEKYTLFTNINMVNIGETRTFCHALLLEDCASWIGDGRDLRLRAFGTDPAWPVFDIRPASLEHEIVTAESASIMIGHEETYPLASGWIMKFKVGPELQVIASDRKSPIRVDRFKGPAGDSPILRVWDVLPARVRQYWVAPNMPTLRWVQVNP